LLRLLLDREFILQKVLKVGADDLGLNLHRIEIHPCFQEDRLRLRLSRLGNIGCSVLSNLTVELLVPVFDVLGDFGVSDDVAEKLEDVDNKVGV